MHLVKEVLGGNDVPVKVWWVYHVLVDNMFVSIVAIFIEKRFRDVIRGTRKGIKPFVVVIEVMVKNAGGPDVGRGENHMRESIPFAVCVGSHGDIRKATTNVEGYNVALVGGDPLLTTNDD
jgi:hypothetical protein